MSVSPTRLPPELRIQIFTYLLRYDGVLQRRSTIVAESLKNKEDPSHSSSAPEHVTRRPVDTTPFLICRTFSEEALDVFYDLNCLKIHYNHLCTCQARFPFAGFDPSRVRRLEIYDFHPRQNVEAVCKTCQCAGVGLLNYLGTLPRLQSAVLAFEDFMSITDFVESGSQMASIEFQASEVGRFHAQARKVDIEVQLPLLNRAWRNLAKTATTSTPLDEGDDLPGEESVRHALEYLQFEANDWGRVPSSLRNFLITDETEDPPLARLRLVNAPDSAHRLLRFTVALAEVLCDLFVEDCASDSMEWEYIGLPETLRWDFRQGIAM